MTLGERILKYRKKAGISQEELADRLNVTRQSISLWETDQTVPSLDSLITLSELFDVSLDELCGRKVKEKTADEQTDENGLITSETQQATGDGEEPRCFACANTILTPSILKNMQKLSQRKSVTAYVVSIVLLAIALISAIVNAQTVGTNESGAVIISFIILFLILDVILLVRLIVAGNARCKKNSEECRNYEYSYLFYSDYMIVKTQSKTANSTFRVKYGDIKRTVTENNVIFIFHDVILPIDKSSLGNSLNVVLGLLKARESAEGNDNAKKENKTSVKHSAAIKGLLLAMFVLSLFSIFIALIIVMICIQTSPTPEFEYNMTEYMWTFYLVIPLPLTSAILGIVFLTKKYKCKKNVIAGFIMCALLALYGSFTFMFKDQIGHDFMYVYNVEYLTGINFPDKGYVIYNREERTGTNSTAMIKFDDKEEILRIVENDERFTKSIPSNIVDSFHITRTSDYDYYFIYDATCRKHYSKISGNHDGHNFIYLAYRISDNILYVLDFEK